MRPRRYPCFGGCECGINVTVFPDRVFYSKVTKQDVGDIVHHVLDEGPPMRHRAIIATSA